MTSACTQDALSRLSAYLSDTTAPAASIDHPRQRCSGCHKSGTVCCPDCLEVFIPRDAWPKSVSSQRLHLPFQLDILLDDRRASSTGVQIATILKAAGHSKEVRVHYLSDPRVELHPISDSTPDVEHDEHDGTFLLFPDVSAVPLSSILNTGKRIKRLIVMDCKWSKFSKTLALPLHKAVTNVQRVKLDDPPNQSFYWRWHNAGEGAVSTIEAIYYAACQIIHYDHSSRPLRTDESSILHDVRLADLLDFFWLFRLQRNIIADRYQEESFSKSRAVPFSKEGKEYHRALRRRQNHADTQQKQVEDAQMTLSDTPASIEA